VIIATPENVQPDIEETLENYGFRHHSRLDSERWGELMKMFHIEQLLNIIEQLQLKNQMLNMIIYLHDGLLLYEW
jgi:hypothetical protein